MFSFMNIGQLTIQLVFLGNIKAHIQDHGAFKQMDVGNDQINVYLYVLRKFAILLYINFVVFKIQYSRYK